MNKPGLDNLEAVCTWSDDPCTKADGVASPIDSDKSDPSRTASALRHTTLRPDHRANSSRRRAIRKSLRRTSPLRTFELAQIKMGIRIENSSMLFTNENAKGSRQKENANWALSMI